MIGVSSAEESGMRIGIVAGEISGDKLGADLIKAIHKRLPDTQFIGIAGPEMIEAGCLSLVPQEKLAVMGLIEILSHFRELYRIRTQLLNFFLENPPDVFIGIDSPEFNLGLEEKLKQAGIKTVHYVSPQVWAWREGRLARIARSTDLILTVLPFEEDYYKKHQIPACFIGHSLADKIPDNVDKQPAREKLNLPVDKKIIALMPGSRSKEWHYHMLLFIRTAIWCQAQNKDLHFIVVLVNQKARDKFELLIQEARVELPLTLIQNNSYDSISAADVVLTVSGTASLEIMLLKRPMVIAYRMAWLTYQIAQRLVKLPYISLPNLLANAETVPEFIQDQATPERLGHALLHWLEHPDEVTRLQTRFDAIHKQLRCNASEQAAEAVLTICKD